MTRNGPKTRASNSEPGIREAQRNRQLLREVVRVARVEHPDAAAERPGASRSDRRARASASARGMTVSREPAAVALPGAEVERVVAEAGRRRAALVRASHADAASRASTRDRRLALDRAAASCPSPRRPRRATSSHERGRRARGVRLRESVDQPERDEQREERQHEDQVARLRRRSTGRIARATNASRRHHARRRPSSSAASRCLRQQRPSADDGEHEHARSPPA